MPAGVVMLRGVEDDEGRTEGRKREQLEGNGKAVKKKKKDCHRHLA